MIVSVTKFYYTKLESMDGFQMFKLFIHAKKMEASQKKRMKIIIPFP